MKLQGVGFSYSLKEIKNKHGQSVWVWEVKQFKEVIGNGYEDDKQTAKNAMMAAMAAGQVRTTEESYERAKHRQKLKYLMKRRPHLMMGICNSILGGFEKIAVMQMAKMLEDQWWGFDTSKHKRPLPKHHLTLRADVVAEQAYDAMISAGLVVVDEDGAPVNTRRLGKWAEDMFGPMVWDGITREAEVEEG